jgi:hypothetical protein
MSSTDACCAQFFAPFKANRATEVSLDALITPSRRMAAFGEMKYAKQVEFDTIVSEIIEEGSRVEDAVEEAKETFSSSGYDLSSLYLYDNETELRDKLAVEGNFKLMEETAAMEEDSMERRQKLVNVYFAIQVSAAHRVQSAVRRVQNTE